MVDETFMLLSMKDSKNVADAMSNKTAQKIIAYLIEHNESTKSELSKELKVPLPTVHYNIKQLKKAKLIEAKEFFWSKKGKEMLVYKLAKKYIIISPDSSEGTLSKLKNSSNNSIKFGWFWRNIFISKNKNDCSRYSIKR